MEPCFVSSNSVVIHVPINTHDDGEFQDCDRLALGKMSNFS